MKVGNFGNRITERDGFTFDSKAEANDWTTLQMMERAGKISQLERQVVFTLQPAFTDNEGKRHRPITWTADFLYIENGHETVWECKGHRTPRFNMVEKMFRYQHPDVKLIINQVGRRKGR